MIVMLFDRDRAEAHGGIQYLKSYNWYQRVKSNLGQSDSEIQVLSNLERAFSQLVIITKF